MGTTPAVPAMRGRDLAELILAESGRAGLGPGSRLPTERRLAADLGVTRTGIRLALAALEADGLISREVGRGTFLRPAAAEALAAARRGQPGASGAVSDRRTTMSWVTGRNRSARQFVPPRPTSRRPT
jgi:DNA-binding FadR family transcriptional regulator